ncbi:hypothetical protein ES705_14012 [subsurface metagenome]
MKRTSFSEESGSDKLEITGLSPIYIGSGDKYSQLDYVSDGNKIHVIDFSKILDHIPLESIDDFTNEINANFKNNVWRGEVKEFLKNYNVDWKDYVEKSYDLVGEIGKNEINQFVKTSDQIYIPGSSVKGAIRTSILYQILKNHPNKRAQISDYISRSYRPRDRDLQRLLRSDGKTDLLRALIVSDSTLKDGHSFTKVVKSNVYHLRERELQSPIFNEILSKDFTSSGFVKINDKLVDSGYLISDFFSLKKEAILEAINLFSREIIEQELQQFKGRDDENLTEIVRFYNGLTDQIESMKDNECILRLGQGSSFIAITMFLQFKDNFNWIKRLTNLEVYHFNAPDREDKRYAIARDRGFTILPDRNSKHKPRLNERWLCKAIRTKQQNRIKIVSLIEQVSGEFNFKNVVYPITRKFVVSGDKPILPYGWVKLKWG